ncbi:ribosome hibernation-promoting factor, HPF/YfiA family [Croceicoccus naphthovorans]|uniref:Ribosome hibernation promoting factor n=1 Tax=Croceicoccus naphthovorans TaxID=1348774 RepID=A0A0G3XKT6_9SPHN|nr:ribosome-associated translation inhibitor RaiA [Croceicoccus naphthovorans]AKM11211.1 30S ribosomal protein S30 [Croceicoccus naphthovorans]MBB3989890.1 ribosomal subunit interface protein [Croceicoccus naphthovorans]
MDIRVSGHQVETGAALQEHAADRMNGIVDKYFNRALSSSVTLGKGPHDSFTVDIVTHVMQGLIVKGHAEAQDAHQAVDKAAEKIDKQLRRYKRRLKDRHEQAEYALKEEDAAYTVFAANENEDDEDVIETDAPPIVAETRTNIPETSVSDAVMMLDLRDTPALFFKNAGTGRHNMVYRRSDGTIGWVEPSN